MDCCVHGLGFWSEPFSSALAPRAIWRLQIFPNGRTKAEKGCPTFLVCLTGPMVGLVGLCSARGGDVILRSSYLKEDSKETLGANYHIYFLLDETNSTKTDTLGHGTSLFGDRAKYKGGYISNRSYVKNAIRPDGSLMVAAKVKFVAPYSISRSMQTVSDDDLAKVWTESMGKLLETPTMTDCIIEVGR